MGNKFKTYLHLLDYLSKFDGRGYKILHERILAVCGDRKTLEQISVEADVSRERIRQMEAKICEMIEKII